MNDWEQLRTEAACSLNSLSHGIERNTAISKKVVIVNSRYWTRKELWGSSSTNNVLLS